MIYSIPEPPLGVTTAGILIKYYLPEATIANIAGYPCQYAIRNKWPAQMREGEQRKKDIVLPRAPPEEWGRKSRRRSIEEKEPPFPEVCERSQREKFTLSAQRGDNYFPGDVKQTTV